MSGRKYSILLYAVMLILNSCHNSGELSNGGTVFRYNESKGISSLDPAYARNQTIIWPVSQIFNGLVQLDDSLHVQAAISYSWKVGIDGLKYTFYLRDDVYFHESKYFKDKRRKLVAQDFVYSFSRILDPEVASPGSWIFEYVDETNPFVALSDTILEINLKQAFPPFLSILAMPYCSAVPEEVVMADPNFSQHPVGTGPFVFKHWTQDEKLVLLKNEAYFEHDENDIPYPYLDAISITFIKDKQSEFLEFLKGNLDFLSGVHTAYKDELLTRSGLLNPKYTDRFQLLTQAYLNTEYLGILMEPANGDSSVLLQQNIRKAINCGFDRAKMMKYLRNNLGYPATAGMIPPGLPGHLMEGQGYIYDPDLSRELLNDAGYYDVEEQAQLTLTTTSDYLDLCEYIQFELEKVGLNIDINVSTGASFRNQVANANLPFFRGSWIADYADAENYLALFYSGNHTPQGPNYTRFSSKEFDLLYEQSLLINNEKIRAEYYRKMDSIVITAAPVVPLYYDMVVRFTQNNIEGFMPNPMNNLVLKNVRKTEENVR